VGLDLAEAKRLLKVIDGERLEALYVLALATGLRRGELLALRWDDIDLGSRQLRVRRAMQRVDGKLHIVELKTSSARRTVVLPQLAARHLQEHKKRQDGERLALGDTWREYGLVFASSIGTPIEPRNVNRRSEREVSGFGYSLGYSAGRFMIASGLLPGALGGTRTPNLLIRSQMLYPLSYERSYCSILQFEPSRCVLEDLRPAPTSSIER
jgi:integrase